MRTKNTSGGINPIELVGILAVMAFLAALLVPKIIASINEVNLGGTVARCNVLRLGALVYADKYGKLGGIKGVGLDCSTNWDAVLLSEGMVTQPFMPRLGSSAEVRLGPALDSHATVTATNAAFDLLGYGTNSAVGSRVVYCVLHGVGPEDAYGLSARIDDVALRPTNYWVTIHLKGRVKYDLKGDLDKGYRGDVCIYIAHK